MSPSQSTPAEGKARDEIDQKLAAAGARRCQGDGLPSGGLQSVSTVKGSILLNEASGSANEVGKPAIWDGSIPGCFQNTLLRVRVGIAGSPAVDP
jgi:hypothetical protein